MSILLQKIAELPWWLIGLCILTLGMAPYVPEPHVWDKLKMLAAGSLTRPIDIFDLVLHGTPWLLPAIKLWAWRAG